MFYTIYKTTNNLDGKIYIGKHQTKDLDDDYLGSGKYLKHAIMKHGIENFTKEILFVFDNEAEMNDKEAELVTEDFVKENTNYNLCPGGQGGWGYINSNNLSNNGSEKHIEKSKKGGIAAAQKQKHLIENDPMWVEMMRAKLSESARKQIENNDGIHWAKGYSHTEEWKQNHSKIMKIKSKGQKNSQFGSMWITNGSKNMKIPKDQDIPSGWSKGRKQKNMVL